jgi:lysophospholipase L1-like esterase
MNKPAQRNTSHVIATLLATLDALALAALVLLPLSWMASPLRFAWGPIRLGVAWGWKPAALAAALLGLRTLAGRAARRAAGPDSSRSWTRRLFPRLCLAVLVPFAFFLLLEHALEAAGFEASLPPIVIRGETGKGQRTSGVIPDPELRWKYNPGVEVVGKVVNRLGFRDREVDPVKAPGVIRVICMGDSCTAHGKVPYSEYLHGMLTNSPPGNAKWEAFNMGVTGYSCVQGLRLFQNRGRALEPDIVTLYFGWNDHWLGGKVPDSNRMALSMSRAGSAAFDALRRKRFGQLLVLLCTPGRTLAFRKAEGCLRVPQEEYRTVMRRFIREIRAAGAVPIVITAPRASRLAEALVRDGEIVSVEEGIRLHDEYVRMTREVAALTRTPLLDLADGFVATGEDEWTLFKGDGIHQEKEGRIRIAERLYAKISELAAGGSLRAVSAR